MTAWTTLVNTVALSWWDAFSRTAWQGALFIAAIFVVCRSFPKIPASVRCALWWLACLKLLAGPIACLAPFATCARRRPGRAGAHHGSGTPHPALAPTRPGCRGPCPRVSQPVPARYPAAAPMATRPKNSTLPWVEVIAVFWLVGLMWRLGTLAKQFRAARKLMDGAELIDSDTFNDLSARIAARMRLHFGSNYTTNLFSVQSGRGWVGKWSRHSDPAR